MQLSGQGLANMHGKFHPKHHNLKQQQKVHKEQSLNPNKLTRVHCLSTVSSCLCVLDSTVLRPRTLGPSLLGASCNACTVGMCRNGHSSQMHSRYTSTGIIPEMLQGYGRQGGVIQAGYPCFTPFIRTQRDHVYWRFSVSPMLLSSELCLSGQILSWQIVALFLFALSSPGSETQFLEQNAQ